MNDSPTIAGLRPSPVIRSVTFQKCGGCIFHQKPDPKGMADCYGHPPSVHIVGAGQDVLGRPGLQLETFVPRLASERPACALFKPKQDFATLGSS